MLFLLTFQFCGFTVTAIAGASCAWLGESASNLLKFGLPAFLLLFLAILCIFFLLFRFSEVGKSASVEIEEKLELETMENKIKEKLKNIDPEDISIETGQLLKLIVALNFVVRGSFMVWETLAGFVMLDMFDCINLECGLLVSISGIFGIFHLLNFSSIWHRHFSNTYLIFLGLFLYAVAALIFMNWGEQSSVSRFCT